MANSCLETPKATPRDYTNKRMCETVNKGECVNR